MKRLSAIVGILLLLCISGCSATTADNASPEVLYENNNTIDLLVYGDTAYVNASDLDWVNELPLEKDAYLGDVQRTGVTKSFTDWDATVLDVGTGVYSVKGREDILLVEQGALFVPYYAYREG